MIIDFHTHVFPDFLAPKVIPKLMAAANIKAYLNGSMADLQRSMEISNIDYSVTLPVASKERQVVSCNNAALDIKNEYSNIFSFGAMHPDFADFKSELKRLYDSGIKGIKLHPDYQSTFFDDTRYKQIVYTAESLGLITVVHTGPDLGLPDETHATASRIKNLVIDVSPEKLVLAHMGGLRQWDEIADKLGGRGIYLDASFALGEIEYLQQKEPMVSRMSKEQFMHCLEAFGDENILFATDSPWGGQKETLAEIEKLNLSAEIAEKILGSNAVKLLDI